MEIGSSVVWILVIFVASCYLAAQALGTTVKYNRHDFPSGFVFGAGTSAYQVEGAADQDGRTPSIWDTYTHAGNVGGATGDVACDAYHKYKEDVQLMADLSLDAYRFSISWSRLIPNGRGPVNPKGLEYYNNLINELIRKGIEPHVTLHHYDLPQALEDEYGGWLNKNIVRDFTAYADVCFMNFGDRVSHWTTINEANVFVMGGYDIGLFPPNRCSAPYCVRGTSSTSRGNSSTEPYLAAHHMIVAHAKVANLYRKKYQYLRKWKERTSQKFVPLVQGKQYGLVGINLFSYWFMPSTNSTEDLAATQRVNDFYLGWFLHPMVYGDYPSSMKASAGSRIPTFTDLESELVKGSLDFIGVNFYAPVPVRDNSESLNWDNRDFNADIGATLMLGELIVTTFPFPVAPWALKGLLEYIHQIYPSQPIYIHENGQRTQRNSSLKDTSRVKSLHANIGGVLDAIRDGVDVRGYFTWSLLDGFELFDGYESAYGLCYVDLDDPDLRRHPKLSASWYAQFLNGKDVSSDEEIDKKELRSSV